MKKSANQMGLVVVEQILLTLILLTAIVSLAPTGIGTEAQFKQVHSGFGGGTIRSGGEQDCDTTMIGSGISDLCEIAAQEEPDAGEAHGTNSTSSDTSGPITNRPPGWNS